MLLFFVLQYCAKNVLSTFQFQMMCDQPGQRLKSFQRLTFSTFKTRDCRSELLGCRMCFAMAMAPVMPPGYRYSKQRAVWQIQKVVKLVVFWHFVVVPPVFMQSPFLSAPQKLKKNRQRCLSSLFAQVVCHPLRLYYIR